MKQIIHILLACLILFSSCNQKQQADEPQKELESQFDTYFTALTNLGKFNGVIYVVQDGEDIIHKAFNLSQDTNNSLHVTTVHQFDIHSVSKVMARYLLLQLEEEGKIHLQDKLNQYIPDFPRGKEICIGMLLDHQSGLPRELSQFEGKLLDLDLPQIIELIKQEALIFEPGKDVQYSNLAYKIIYYLIGEITGETFEKALNKRLFIPLEMTSSGAHFYAEQGNPKNLAANHEVEEDTIIQVPNILEDEFKTARIYSTTTDLMILLQEFQHNPIAHKMMKDSVVQHSGGSDGIRAHAYTNWKNKSSFVLLCNFDGIPFQVTIKDMINILEGKPYNIPKKINRKSVEVGAHILNKYKGTYTFADMNKLKLLFDVADGQLIVFQDNEQIATLLAENDSTFFEQSSDAEVFEFISNQEGDFEVLMGWRGVKLKGVKEGE